MTGSLAWNIGLFVLVWFSLHVLSVSLFLCINLPPFPVHLSCLFFDIIHLDWHIFFISSRITITNGRRYLPIQSTGKSTLYTRWRGGSITTTDVISIYGKFLLFMA
jgi:hypothetical protein